MAVATTAQLMVPNGIVRLNPEHEVRTKKLLGHMLAEGK